MSETGDAAAADPTDIDPAGASPDDTGLDDLPDGSGCAEIWDYLSDRRRED